MYSIVYTIGMVALWIVNLFNGTGLGETYHTNEIAMVVAIIAAVICLASQTLYEGDILVKPRYFYTLLAIAVLFVGTSLYRGRNLAGLEMFWVYLLVYVLSRTRPNNTAIRMTAISYGLMGLFILAVYSYSDVLKGWNPNSIAMIGLFSFLIFTIPFFGMREWRSFIALPLIGTAYVVLLLPTDSRSCILVIIVQLLLILRIIPIKKLLESPKAVGLILWVPVLVAALVVVMSVFGDVSGLTEWSYETFNKPLFNGRDKTWLRGFQQIFKDPLIGNGTVWGGYWHNCAMVCMTGFGIGGYYLWVRLFHLILKEGQPYLEDTVVTGSMVAFLILFCQQSVELGIFAPTPHVLPYVMLGILLGRVRYLRKG